VLYSSGHEPRESAPLLLAPCGGVDMLTSASRPQCTAVFLVAALLLAACQTPPRVTSQVAPAANLAQFHTYAFMDKLSTDTAGYTSITTQIMKEAVTRELSARGFTLSAQPQLLVNFVATTKDKVEGDADPRFDVSYGHWDWGRAGWGADWGGSDIHTVREDTLTVDLVEKAENVLVWSGSAIYRPTEKDENDARPVINDAMARVFARYPVAAR
jgi:hypothetical protein